MQIMSYMIDFVTSYSLGKDDEAWKGYFYAGNINFVIG